jgi:putative acetyltransferase
VTVWSAWENAKIASIGALKMLPDGTAEIKSMRTHPVLSGVVPGAIILKTIIAAAPRGEFAGLVLKRAAEVPFTPLLHGIRSMVSRKAKLTQIIRKRSLTSFFI